MTTAIADADRMLRTIEHAREMVEIPPELTILEDGQNPEPGQVCWRFLSQKDGDKRVVWNSGSIPEINAAKEMFQELVSQGMTPYRVEPGGGASPRVMDEFDASAEEVIFMPTKMIAAG